MKSIGYVEQEFQAIMLEHRFLEQRRKLLNQRIEKLNKILDEEGINEC